MRAAAADGRIGPGSIPAVVQGRGVWQMYSWVEATVLDAPSQPVWQIAPQNYEINAYQIYTQPSCRVRMSCWARGLGLQGTAPAFFLYIQNRANPEQYKIGQVMTCAQTDTGWRFLTTLLEVPPWTGSTKLVMSARNTASPGLIQVCGAQLSTIGAIPVL